MHINTLYPDVFRGGGGGAGVVIADYWINRQTRSAGLINQQQLFSTLVCHCCAVSKVFVYSTLT